jgi:hypothetical protein
MKNSYIPQEELWNWRQNVDTVHKGKTIGNFRVEVIGRKGAGATIYATAIKSKPSWHIKKGEQHEFHFGYFSNGEQSYSEITNQTELIDFMYRNT